MPIRVRVTLAFAGAMALLLVGLGLFVVSRFQGQLDETIDERLSPRLGELTRAVRADGPEDLMPSGVEESFGQVLDARGTVVRSPDSLRGVPLLNPAEVRAALEGSTVIERREVVPLDVPARLVAGPARNDDTTYVVVAGSSLDDRDEALDSLLALLALGGPAALLLASLAGYLAVSGALRPVEAMRRRAAAISAAEPGERLPAPVGNDEIARLGSTLNAMLGRLEETLARERRFVDDASHELRTPLALHKTELELALRQGRDVGELRAAIASSVEEVDRVIALAEGLLVVARSHDGRIPLRLERLDAGQLLATMRERFAARADQEGRKLVVEPSIGLLIEADRQRLEQALTNVVDNALRHGSGQVRLSARARDGMVELRVADDGEGFPAGFAERAFQRFSRADPARARGGSGLGLAIVDAVARSHHGEAGAANGAGGGAEVWIAVPGPT